MSVRYDKLWVLMKQNKMKKSDFAKAAELSQYAMTKLNQDKVVSMDVMLCCRFRYFAFLPSLFLLAMRLHITNAITILRFFSVSGKGRSAPKAGV